MMIDFAQTVLELVQLPLTNPTSNDNYWISTGKCQNDWGGPCSEDRPIDFTQDESVTDNWYRNEPYACTLIYNTNGLAEYWQAEIAGGTMPVKKIEILSNNN